jgi:hypothetical protein
MASMDRIVFTPRPGVHAVVSLLVMLAACGMVAGLLGSIYGQDYDARRVADTTPLPHPDRAPVYDNLLNTDIAFSADGRYVALVQSLVVPQLVVRDAGTLDAVTTVTDHIFHLPFAFAADSNTVYFRDLRSGDSVRAFDLNTRRFATVLTGIDSTTVMTAAPDGHTLALNDRGRFIEVYDLNNPAYPRRFAVTDAIHALHYSPSGQTLAIHMTQQVALWTPPDAATAATQPQTIPFAVRVRGVDYMQVPGRAEQLIVGLDNGRVISVHTVSGDVNPLPIRVRGSILGVAVHGDRVALHTWPRWGWAEAVEVWQVSPTGETDWEAVRVHHIDLGEFGAYGIGYHPGGDLYILPGGIIETHPVYTPPPMIVPAGVVAP